MLCSYSPSRTGNCFIASVHCSYLALTFERIRLLYFPTCILSHTSAASVEVGTDQPVAGTVVFLLLFLLLLLLLLVYMYIPIQLPMAAVWMSQ